MECVHDSHLTGLFAEAVWLRLLADAGFVAEAVDEVTTDERSPRRLFIGRRPPLPAPP